MVHYSVPYVNVVAIYCCESEWQAVIDEDNQEMRFFMVEVLLP